MRINGPVMIKISVNEFSALQVAVDRVNDQQQVKRCRLPVTAYVNGIRRMRIVACGSQFGVNSINAILVCSF